MILTVAFAVAAVLSFIAAVITWRSARITSESFSEDDYVDRPQWVDQIREIESRMETITNAVVASNDRKVAAIDALRPSAQTKRIARKDDRGIDGTIEGIFNRDKQPVLIESNFGSGQTAVKTRYYLDNIADPLLVTRTYQTRNGPNEPWYSQTNRWYFAGRAYLTFRWDWDPPSAKSSDIIYAPESKRDIDKLRGEIATYLQAFGVKTASSIPSASSMPLPTAVVDSINRRVAAIDAADQLTTFTEALATSPRFGNVTIQGVLDGEKLVKARLTRTSASLPPQAVLYDARGRRIDSPPAEIYYFDADGHLILARTWTATRTDAYASRESTVPETTYWFHELDFYFDKRTLVARLYDGKPDIDMTDGLGEADTEQADNLLREIDDYKSLIQSVSLSSGVLRDQK